jgi:hypothetical protein
MDHIFAWQLISLCYLGTASFAPIELFAFDYAYRVKRNTSIGCIVYGSIDRSRSSDPAEWAGSVYDETALVQLDEIVRMLADRGVASPREAIRQILSL